MKHLADPTKLHGIRCNHVGNTDRTFDPFFVTCNICRGLGPSIETPPERALRYEGVLSWLDGGEMRPGFTLDLHNLIFVDGGSLVWFEEPDVVAVMHARGGSTVRRYQGEWVPK